MREKAALLQHGRVLQGVPPFWQGGTHLIPKIPLGIRVSDTWLGWMTGTSGQGLGGAAGGPGERGKTIQMDHPRRAEGAAALARPKLGAARNFTVSPSPLSKLKQAGQPGPRAAIALLIV